MAEISDKEKAAMLDAEANKLDTLLSEGDPDAALSVIGGIASALTSSNEDKTDSGSDSASTEKDEEQLKKEAEVYINYLISRHLNFADFTILKLKAKFK